MEAFAKFAGAFISAISQIPEQEREKTKEDDEAEIDQDVAFHESFIKFMTATGIEKKDLWGIGQALHRQFDIFKYKKDIGSSLEGNRKILYLMYEESNSRNFFGGGLSGMIQRIDIPLNEIFQKSTLMTYLQDDDVIRLEGKICRVILCRILSSNIYVFPDVYRLETECKPKVDVRYETKVSKQGVIDSATLKIPEEEWVFEKYPSDECFEMISTLLRTSNRYEILKESCSADGSEDFMQEELNYYNEIFPEIIKECEKWVLSNQPLIKPCDE